MNADDSAELPRPALLQLAISSIVIALAALGIYRNLTEAVGSYYGAAANLGLLVMQVRSTFIRSYRDALVCSVLLAVFAGIGAYRWYVMPSDRWGNWNLLCDFERWRTGVVTLFFAFAAVVSALWCWGLAGFKAPARWIRRYSLDEMAVMLLSLCLVPALFAGMYRKPPDYEEMSEVYFSTDWKVAAEQKKETAALAEMLRPKLPVGWTLKVRGREVMIERNEPIETFWWISFPMSVHNLTEARAYRRANLGGYRRPQKFAVVLWLDDRVSVEKYAEIAAKNEAADNKAREETTESKFIPTRRNRLEHPEYGYRRLPSFATENRSVYMKVNPPDMSIWEYLNADEETDCEALLKIVREQFPTVYRCEKCVD